MKPSLSMPCSFFWPIVRPSSQRENSKIELAFEGNVIRGNFSTYCDHFLTWFSHFSKNFGLIKLTPMVPPAQRPWWDFGRHWGLNYVLLSCNCSSIGKIEPRLQPQKRWPQPCCGAGMLDPLSWGRRTFQLRKQARSRHRGLSQALQSALELAFLVESASGSWSARHSLSTVSQRIVRSFKVHPDFSLRTEFCCDFSYKHIICSWRQYTSLPLVSAPHLDLDGTDLAQLVDFLYTVSG